MTTYLVNITNVPLGSKARLFVDYF